MWRASSQLCRIKTFLAVVVVLVVVVVVVVVIGKYLLQRVHCGGLPCHCAGKIFVVVVVVVVVVWALTM